MLRLAAQLVLVRASFDRYIMGKGAQQLTSPAVKDAAAKDVLIHGQLYDVTNFKHPGGSIVKFLTNNGDATEAFVEFHGRSKKAQAMLKAMPKVPADAETMKARGYNGKEVRSSVLRRILRDFDRDQKNRHHRPP